MQQVIKNSFSILFVSIICGCSILPSDSQKVSYAELRRIEKDNEDAMRWLNISLQELDEKRNVSRAFPPARRQFIDSRADELWRQRLRDAIEMRDRLQKYSDDLVEEKKLYE